MVFSNFTPVSGFTGGAMIGLSAATLLIFNGDILGASGMASSFVVAPKKTLTDPGQQWKLFFIIAFFVTSRIYLLIDPTALDDTRSDQSIPIVSPLGFLIGGGLVGFGTRLGNGCTTGHGICGMARLSVRSFVGVMSFMFSGFLFASVCPETNPHLRSSEAPDKYQPTLASNIVVSSIIIIVAIFAFVGLARHKNPPGDAKDELTKHRRKILPSIFAAVIFAVALIVSQMTLYSKIFGFLNLTLIPHGTWDPTLVMVMGGGLLVSFLSYQWVKGFNLLKNSHALECPLSQKNPDSKFNLPANKVIDFKLILGEAIFGLGWGMAGICPGPAMVLASCGYPSVLYRWWPMFLVGSFLAEKVKVLLHQVSNKPELERDESSSKIKPTEETKESAATKESAETEDAFAENV